MKHYRVRDGYLTIRYSNWEKIFYKNGKKFKSEEFGNIFWWKDGVIHRSDGPAIECANGTKHWFKEGRRHRENGPAIEFRDGCRSWYLNGRHIKSEW